MSVSNNLPPLPPQYLFGDSVNGASSNNNPSSLPDTNTNFSLLTVELQQFQDYLTSLTTALNASPSDPDAISGDLSLLQGSFDSLGTVTGGGRFADIGAVFTKLATDIGNNNYTAALTDISNFAAPIKVATDVAALNDAWEKMETDLVIASPNQATLQNDYTAISSLVKTLIAETSSYGGGNLNNDLSADFVAIQPTDPMSILEALINDNSFSSSLSLVKSYFLPAMSGLYKDL